MAAASSGMSRIASSHVDTLVALAPVGHTNQRRASAPQSPSSSHLQRFLSSSARRWSSRRRQQAGAAAAFRRIVATSEHWYEDEEEFDALTDAMKPKMVVLATAPPLASDDGAFAAAVDTLRALLEPVKFDQAFASQTALPFAQRVWAGRDKAPYFLKVRARVLLDAAGSGEQAAAAAVWQELLQQNWRVELDAGLGGPAPEVENLLVVCSPAAAAELLAAAKIEHGSAAFAAGSVWVLRVEGTHAGDPLDWQQLGKRLTLAEEQPSSNTNLLAALEAATATASGRQQAEASN